MSIFYQTLASLEPQNAFLEALGAVEGNHDQRKGEWEWGLVCSAKFSPEPSLPIHLCPSTEHLGVLLTSRVGSMQPVSHWSPVAGSLPCPFDPSGAVFQNRRSRGFIQHHGEHQEKEISFRESQEVSFTHSSAQNQENLSCTASLWALRRSAGGQHWQEIWGLLADAWSLLGVRQM